MKLPPLVNVTCPKCQSPEAVVAFTRGSEHKCFCSKCSYGWDAVVEALEIEKGHNDQPEGPAIGCSGEPASGLVLRHSRLLSTPETTAHLHRMLIVVRPRWLSAAVA